MMHLPNLFTASGGLRPLGDLRLLVDKWRHGPNAEVAGIAARSSPELLGPLPPGTAKGRVLFFVPRYWPIHQGMELVMAWALRAEGYDCTFATCGHAMRDCDAYLLEDEPEHYCDWCAGRMGDLLRLARFPHRTYADLFDAAAWRARARAMVEALTLEECLAFEHGGQRLGWLTEMSVVRSCRQSVLSRDPRALGVFRDYLESALLTQRAAEVLLAEPWSFIVMLNGKFFTEAVVYDAARRRGIDVVTYERGFAPDQLVFCANDTVNDFRIGENFRRIAHLPLSPAQEARVDAIAARRRAGKGTVINYFPNMDEDRARIMAALALDPVRPVDVAYPNILWDTAVFRRDTAFTGLWPWIRHTLQWYAAHPGRQLIVRVHPAEVQLPMKTLERVGRLIEEEFPRLPANIRVIPAEDGMSSYVLMDLSERVLVYSSTMGLEAAVAGHEVITAGMVHYRQLGFTRDAGTAEEYDALLSSPPQPLSAEGRALARRYLYTFFENYAINVTSIGEPRFGHWKFQFRSVDELLASSCELVRFVRGRLLPIQDGHYLKHPDGHGPDPT